MLILTTFSTDKKDSVIKFNIFILVIYAEAVRNSI